MRILYTVRDYKKEDTSLNLPINTFFPKVDLCHFQKKNKKEEKKRSYYRDLEKIEHEKHSVKYRYINSIDIPRIRIPPMIHPIINPTLELVS